jgi:hypothetical protein
MTDSHEKIIREFALNADGVSGPNIVRFEITPPNGDWSAPLDRWGYHVDQDRTPDWYDATEAERAARLMLVDWAKAKLVRDGENRNVNDGETVIAVTGNGKVGVVWGNGKVGEVTGNGKVGVVTGNGKVGVVRGNGTVGEVTGNGKVGEVRDNGKVGAVRDSATVSFRCAFSCKLTGALAVIINRIGSKAKCYVGTEKTRTVKGK